MLSKINKTTIIISLTYIVLAASVGVFFPFNALYLSSTLNFTNTQISLIDGLGQLGAMFLLPISGLISDKTGKPSFVFAFLMLLSGILLLLYANLQTYLFVALVYIAYLALRRGIFPILDALTLKYCEQQNLDFGIFRAIYSGTYMLFALLVGYLFNAKTQLDNSFIYLSIGFNIFVLILSYFLPRSNIALAIEEFSFKSALKNLKSNHMFLLISTVVALGMATVSIIAMYNSTIITELGGTIENIGYTTILQVGSEVIFALFALKIAKKIGHLKVIGLALALLSLCWFFIYDIYTFNLYFSLLWIEGFATVFLLIVGMDYIKSIVALNLISTAISTYTSITLLFYFVLVNLAGIIRDYYSTKSMFLFLLFISIIALIILIITIYFNNKKALVND